MAELPPPDPVKIKKDCVCGGDCACNNPALQLSFHEILEAHLSGIIGLVEFRSWIARRDQDFNIIRDPDVDKNIQALAEKAKEEQFAE